MQLSVMVSNLGQPFEQALETTQQLDIPAVQISLGEHDDAQKRAEMMRAVRASGLAVSAISCEIGHLGEPDWAAKVEGAKPYIDAAAEMGNNICQTHVGVMPHNARGERWDRFVQAGEKLAEYAQSVGACVALETGPEPASVMEKLMLAVNSPGLRVNYDPANFIIWPAAFPRFADLLEHTGKEPYVFEKEAAMAEFEPVEGVKRLAPFIVHAHAKDAIGDGGWADVPLGQGWIDWPRFLTLLKEGGFNGYLAIEREGGNDPLGEIGHAARFLREQLKSLEN